MSRIGFIFICALYITVSILSFARGLSVEVQLITCGIFVLLVGIPHGAIDHILYLQESKVKPTLFFTNYLLSMAAYILLWIVFPAFSLILFLFLSAYHFGESQLAGMIKSKPYRIISFLIWGTNILSGLIYYNHGELINIFSSYSDLEVLKPILNDKIHLLILIATSAIIIIFSIIVFRKHLFKLETIGKEIYILGLIHIAFYILPVIPAFTIYFVILHSIKVLVDEYSFLKTYNVQFNILKFIKELIPFTLLSFIGGIFLFLMIKFQILNMSYVLLSIILISIITLPHSLVMQKFYQPKKC